MLICVVLEGMSQSQSCVFNLEGLLINGECGGRLKGNATQFKNSQYFCALVKFSSVLVKLRHSFPEEKKQRQMHMLYMWCDVIRMYSKTSCWALTFWSRKILLKLSDPTKLWFSSGSSMSLIVSVKTMSWSLFTEHSKISRLFEIMNLLGASFPIPIFLESLLRKVKEKSMKTTCCWPPCCFCYGQQLKTE